MQLKELFRDYDIKIENAGTTVLITLPNKISSEEFLSILVNHKISLSYFRDISHSTRKLFHRDI
jgi:hypothetical protein